MEQALVRSAACLRLSGQLVSAPATSRHPTVPRFPGRQLPHWRGSARRAATGGGGVEVEQNPLFTPGFAAVLQGALARQGEEALYSGAQRATEPKERRSAASEEVLQAALHSSRQTIKGLMAIKQEIEGALTREKKQFDRLHFALKKVHSDGAYLHTIEEMLEEAQTAEELQRVKESARQALLEELETL